MNEQAKFTYGNRIPISKAYEPQKYGGETFDKQLDQNRLDTQLERVKSYMADGRWVTLRELASQCKCSESSSSARIRDLKKVRFGSYEIEKKRLENGLWMYRVKK